jgi:Lipopolysaccharide kinase (Kdo/WaaP) family.
MRIEGEVYRQVEGRRTLRFEAGGRGYFIKTHSGVGWQEIFKELTQGRLPILGAENEYRALKRLPELKIGTMTLAGYGKRGWNPAHQESFVITESLDNRESLEDFCAKWPKSPPSPRLKRLLIDKVAEVARKLHENGLNHRDLYICHFLLEVSRLPEFLEKGGVQLELIDLHRMQFRQKTPLRWRVKDVAALHFSSMDIGLTKRDQLRFIRLYSQKPLSKELKENGGFWEKVQKRAENSMLSRTLGRLGADSGGFVIKRASN